MLTLRPHVDVLGRNHFKSWFDKLDDNSQARVGLYLDRLERGNFSAVKSVGGGVLELRMDFGPGFRVYFGRDGDTIVILLCGGTKKRQHADIEVAKRLWTNYKASGKDERNATRQRL